MSSLVKTNSSEADMRIALKNSLYIGASDASVDMVLAYCRAAGLDVMQKPVHIVPMWDSKSGGMRDVIMPGIGLYRTQASRSGEMAGVSEPVYGEDVQGELGGVKFTYPAWCKVTVKRLLPNGAIAEFVATERWIENYAVKGGKDKSIAPNSMWQKRPYGQIAKCAEAQALRKAFPELCAAPTAEEMDGKTYNDQPLQQADVIDPLYEAYEAANLTKLQDAALDGAGVLQIEFERLAKCQQKSALWKNHGAALKAAAKAVDEQVVDTSFAESYEAAEAQV